jgi:hypothetical protein
MGNHIKKSGCCNDKQISSTLSTEQQATAKWVQVTKQTLTAPVSQATNTLFTGYVVTKDRLARGTPVPISPVPIFIKNCVFRI